MSEVTFTDADGTVRLRGTLDGGSPGSVRRLTFNVQAADLAEGPATLYEPEASEVVGPVYLYDVTFCNSSTGIVVAREEQVAGDNNYPPLAGWDSDIAKDGATLAVAASDRKIVPLTAGPVTAGFTTDGSISTLPAPAWAQGTYAQFDTIIAAGHTWYADPGGASGASKPNFAAHFGGTVTDGSITWNDNADATAGAATVSMDVCVPDEPS